MIAPFLIYYNISQLLFLKFSLTCLNLLFKYSGIDGMLNNLSQKISCMQHKIKFYFMLSINLYSVVNLLHVHMILF